MQHEIIDTREKLITASKHWNIDIGVDIECENNLHHFGAYISIIQISNGSCNWIVDVLTLREVPELVDMFHDDRYQKIFHDVGFDLRMLTSELNCCPKNIFDTQLAARFLGQTELGLAALLEKYFGITKQSKFQMADWTKRPITGKMLDYAAGDTAYLLKLRDKMLSEMPEEHKEWMQQELKHIEEKKLCYEEPGYQELKGVRKLLPNEMGIFKELYKIREDLARKVDKPCHFIFSNKRMKEFAMNPPDWKNLTGVHPIVRRQHYRFEQAVRNARPIHIPSKKKIYYTPRQACLLKTLTEYRDKLEETLGIDRNILLSKDDMHSIITGKDVLRSWQKKLFRPALIDQVRNHASRD